MRVTRQNMPSWTLSLMIHRCKWLYTLRVVIFWCYLQFFAISHSGLGKDWKISFGFSCPILESNATHPPTARNFTIREYWAIRRDSRGVQTASLDFSDEKNQKLAFKFFLKHQGRFSMNDYSVVNFLKHTLFSKARKTDGLWNQYSVK